MQHLAKSRSANVSLGCPSPFLRENALFPPFQGSFYFSQLFILKCSNLHKNGRNHVMKSHSLNSPIANIPHTCFSPHVDQSIVPCWAVILPCTRMLLPSHSCSHAHPIEHWCSTGTSCVAHGPGPQWLSWPSELSSPPASIHSGPRAHLSIMSL